MTRKTPTATVRCAIYTRKSTEEGLEQEFNSLDAQRESAEAYIKSQAHEGWRCLADAYDDGGFTGGNMDRPALKRLIADIEAGRIDAVVVYKVDRLSRSLLDFAKMMEVFERHHVSFVSVTQQFNTATSMGRLILNVLLSFAQFEREMISERTRDKIAATRRKGKWAGGMPVLGYDVVDTKLVVVETEAERVREIFALYLELGSLIAVAAELNRRGWRTKQWTTKKTGDVRGGRTWDKNAVHQVLTNPVYVGKVRYKDEVHKGEHAAIVEPGVFERVQKLLAQNGRTSGRGVRNKHGALLRGKLRCAACNCAMGHSFTVRGPRRYRYYICVEAQKRGWDTCPAPSIPAGEIERFLVEQIKCIGRDPGLVTETLRAVRAEVETRVAGLERERVKLRRQMGRDHGELTRLAKSRCKERTSRMADANDRIGAAERRLSEIRDELVGLQREVVSDDEVAAALAAFDGVWDALKPREQERVLDLLIESVDFDGAGGDLAITFRPAGIKTLAEEAA